MRRTIVLGGRGFFGRVLVERLRAAGIAPLVSSRRGDADLRIDADDAASLMAALRPGDLVIDAAGPFQRRTAALIDVATETGIDVIDLSDSLDYALLIDARRQRIAAAGIRVLTSCSSISTNVAVLVATSGIARPVRISIFLAPATRHTATRGTAGALEHSLGRPVRSLRDGAIASDIGWRETRRFLMPAPIGRLRAFKTESAAVITLPWIWPTLGDVDFWVDPRSTLLRALFASAARVPAMRRIVLAAQTYSLPLARVLGARAGGFGVEIEDEHGRIARRALVAERNSYLSAVAPAVLAARAVLDDRFPFRGIVPHDRHVEPEALLASLAGMGIRAVDPPLDPPANLPPGNSV